MEVMIGGAIFYIVLGVVAVNWYALEAKNKQSFGEDDIDDIYQKRLDSLKK